MQSVAVRARTFLDFVVMGTQVDLRLEVVVMGTQVDSGLEVVVIIMGTTELGARGRCYEDI